MDATRISDGKPVMLKRLVKEEGPYELQINNLFSTEPLSSDPRNRCVQLLDVIALPDDPPIMVHPLLRPFYDPAFRTYGEFVTFYAQVCEVCLLLQSGIRWLRAQKGGTIHAFEQCCSSVCPSSSLPQFYFLT
jgi:hypothetical protein